MAKEKMSTDVLAERIDNYMKSIQIQLESLHEKADKTNGKVMLNSEHRIKTEAILSAAKAIGFINIIGVIAIAIKQFG